MEEAHAATASISRTHSQCQRGATAPRVRGRSREDLVFIPGNFGEAIRAPSAAAKLRLMARCAALAVLAAGAI
jgi:hypothetical protein